MNHNISIIRLVGVAVAVGGLLVGARLTTPATASGESGWSVVSSPNPSTYANILNAVAAISASDVWAVGSYYDSQKNVLETLTEHWNGRKWSVVSSPNLSGTYGSANILRGVAVLSTGDVWAVGHYQNYGTNQQHQTLTEHWNGASWSIVSSPNAGKADDLNGVAILSSSEAWAVGIYSNYGNDYYNNFSAPQTLVLKR